MGFILAAVVPDEERTAGTTTPPHAEDASRARPLDERDRDQYGAAARTGDNNFSRALTGTSARVIPGAFPPPPSPRRKPGPTDDSQLPTPFVGPAIFNGSRLSPG